MENIEATWKNQGDVPDTIEYHIDHLEPQKRMRVWVTQQLEDVIEDLNPSNYLTELVRFMRGCDNLSRCYKNHQGLGHIDEIRVEFWARYQMIVKLKIKPMIKRICRAQVKRDLQLLRFPYWK